MTPPVPQLRIRQTPPRAPTQLAKIRISIGATYRDIPLIDARHIADRIHDVCDRLEQRSPEPRPTNHEPEGTSHA